MAVVTVPVLEWELRNANGRLTDRDVLALPDQPVPLPDRFVVPRTLDQTTQLLTKVLAEKYRVERCTVCGGPKVYSKLHPIARCLRCGTAEALGSVAFHERQRSWRRCALCDQPTMAGLPVRQKYCRPCTALSPRERSKRLRWKAERVQSASKSTNEIKGQTAVDPGQTANDLRRPK